MSSFDTLAAQATAARLARHGLIQSDGPDDDQSDLDFSEFTFPLAIHVVYVNAAGDPSERAVTVRKIWRQDGVVYFRGRCHIRNADRTFRADRVEELTCLATGEVTEDIEDWLLDLCTAPSVAPNPTAEAIRSSADELEVLAYMARVDELHSAEVDVIVRFVQSRYAPPTDADAVARYVRKLTPSYYQIAPIIRRLAGQPERWNALRMCVLDLLKADGDVTEDELVSWRELSELAAEHRPGSEATVIAFEEAVVQPTDQPGKVVWISRALALFRS